MKGLKALKAIENELKFYYQDEWNIVRYPKDIAIIEKELKEGEANKNASEILRIIFNAPFIIETLFNKKELGKSATDRYLWGTISDEEVKKIKEFFSDGKI